MGDFLDNLTVFQNNDGEIAALPPVARNDGLNGQYEEEGPTDDDTPTSFT